MILLALLMTAGTPAEAWVATSGTPPDSCGDAALVRAVHQWRPQLNLHAGTTTELSALQVLLEHGAGTYTLRLRGPDLSIVRTFQDKGDCEGAIRTAALMVDGALDQLAARGAAPQIDLAPPPPSPQLEIAAVVEGSVLQGVFGITGAPGVSLLFRDGLAEWGVSGELEPPVSAPGSGTPASDPGTVTHWTWQAISGGVEVTGGVGPRIGPGRLSVAGGLGVEATTVSVPHFTLGQLFQARPATTAAPFAALRVGYTVDLPRGFFVTAWVEERLAPVPASVGVQGVTGGGSSVFLLSNASDHQLATDGTVGIGWRFW